MTIIPFGRIAEIIAVPDFLITDIEDTNTLKSYLEDTYPALKNMKYALAVNKQVVTEKTFIPDGATIALLPPFSGG